MLGILAAGRTPESFIAGGIAINREGPRYSRDIDIFQDSEEVLAAAAEADHRLLIEAGMRVNWRSNRTGHRSAIVSADTDSLRLEWVHDSAFRFYPAQSDAQFGYVLHPVDLAANKVSAAADRREARDIVDLVTIHENILPLGAAICAAVGRFPGQSPEEMLAEIRRHSRLSAEEIESLAMDGPLDVKTFTARVRAMLDEAEEFIRRLPSDAVGVVFLRAGKWEQPDLDRLGEYDRRSGSRGGIWPSSSAINRAMLGRYTGEA